MHIRKLEKESLVHTVASLSGAFLLSGGPIKCAESSRRATLQLILPLLIPLLPSQMPPLLLELLRSSEFPRELPAAVPTEPVGEALNPALPLQLPGLPEKVLCGSRVPLRRVFTIFRSGEAGTASLHAQCCSIEEIEMLQGKVSCTRIADMLYDRPYSPLNSFLSRTDMSIILSDIALYHPLVIRMLLWHS